MRGNCLGACPSIPREPRWLWAALALWQSCALAAGTGPHPATEIVAQLMNKDLVGVPGKEVVMLTVQYLPGGASLPHRHDAQVFVYVLEGELTMQIAGSPAVTLRQGETFYENPSDIHL